MCAKRACQTSQSGALCRTTAAGRRSEWPPLLAACSDGRAKKRRQSPRLVIDPDRVRQEPQDPPQPWGNSAELAALAVRDVLARGLPLAASAFPGAAPLGEGELLLDRFHDAQRREGSDMAVGTQNGAGIPARDARCDVRPTILNERTSPRPRYLCWRIEQISW